MLTEGPVWRLMLSFSLPLMLSSIFQQLYGAVNIVFLGRFASAEALAGAGNGSTLIYALNSMFLGLSTGGMIVLGRFFGAKDDERSAKTVGNVILLQAAAVALTMGLIFVFGKALIRLINVPGAGGGSVGADTEAWNYMRICAFGLIFNAGYNIVSSVLRAIGNSAAPMVFVVVSCCVNVLLDYVFVGVLRRGASGAATATVIAQAASFLLSMLYLFWRKLPFSVKLSDLRPSRNTMVSIFKLGLPISLQSILNILSFTVIAAIINGMGLFYSAANGVVNNLMNFYFVIPIAIGQALSAFSAQNIGAGKPDRAKQGLRICIIASLAIAVPCTVLASFWPTPIASLLASDPDVITASAQFLIPYSWDCIFVGCVFCINGFLNSCGLTAFVAAHETAAAFLVRIPVTWLMSRVAGATLFHVGIGTPAATLASLIICFVYYKVRLSRGRLSSVMSAMSGSGA